MVYGQPRPCAINKLDPQLLIHREDNIRGMLQHRAELFLTLTQLFLGLFALGDVTQDDLDGRYVVYDDPAGCHFHRDRSALQSNYFLFHGWDGYLIHQDLLDSLTTKRVKIRMEKIIGRTADDLVILLSRQAFPGRAG